MNDETSPMHTMIMGLMDYLCILCYGGVLHGGVLRLHGGVLSSPKEDLQLHISASIGFRSQCVSSQRLSPDSLRVLITACWAYSDVLIFLLAWLSPNRYSDRCVLWVKRKGQNLRCLRRRRERNLQPNACPFAHAC